MSIPIRLCLIPLLLLPLAVPALAGETALDQYVKAPDRHYHYELRGALPGEGYRAFVLEMTSQAWLSPETVDRPVWKHWLTVVRPERVATHRALLFITGGDNSDPPPEAVNPLLAQAALATSSVVAELRMVPNQPLTFTDAERRPRWEDALIAYGWDKFLRGGPPIWLARLPMTKSAVRALDTITDFAAGSEMGALRVDEFVVAGASKRGWTTWTTAAVDPRVVAIAPLVIDLLNVEPSFAHHFSAYGFWAPAVQDYEEHGIMTWQGTPEYRALLEIVEPFTYRDRLKLPKLLINATGDQFFLPDSSQFYFDELEGEKHLRYVPNTDHSLEGSDAAQTLIAFYHSIVAGTPRPSFSWKVDGETLTVETESERPPQEVRLWQASNPSRRDFRVETIGKAWASRPLTGDRSGVYSAKLDKPLRGWTAFLVELTYPGPGDLPLKLTTEVRVLPETLPFTFPLAADQAVAGSTP